MHFLHFTPRHDEVKVSLRKHWGKIKRWKMKINKEAL